jgi:hypothetical protein
MAWASKPPSRRQKSTPEVEAPPSLPLLTIRNARTVKRRAQDVVRYSTATALMSNFGAALLRRPKRVINWRELKAGYDLSSSVRNCDALRPAVSRARHRRAVTTNDRCAIARRWDVTSGSAWLLGHYRSGREERRAQREVARRGSSNRGIGNGTERTSRPSVSPRNGDRDAPTLHDPQCRCRNAATTPRRGTLRAKALVFYGTNEVGRTRYDPTLRAPGRGTKRRIGGRRSPSIVRLLDGKVLGGNGQGSATSRTVGALLRHSMPGVPTSLGG